MDAAGVMGHRQRAVDRCNHLRQPAGLKTGRHQDKISGTVSQMFHFIAKFTNCYAFLKLVIINDVPKGHLIISIGYEYDLQILVPVAGDYPVEYFCQ